MSFATKFKFNILGGYFKSFTWLQTVISLLFYSQVDYTIRHQAGSLTNIDVFISLTDISGDVTAVEQTHTLTFLEQNQTSTFKRSGNPGYIVGQPVLAGKRIEDYIDLNGDRFKYLTMVTASSDGDCVSDSLLRESVLFGEDMRAGCLWRLKRSDLASCRDMQAQIVEALLGPSRSINNDGSLYLATFGNSDPLKIGDWVKVIVVNQLSDKLCTGVFLHLEILYAYIGALSNPQAKIVGAKLTLKSTELDYYCWGPFCQSQNDDQTQNVEMVSSVAFVDVSEPAVAAIAEEPVAASKLPADFFHPYYIENPNN